MRPGSDERPPLRTGTTRGRERSEGANCPQLGRLNYTVPDVLQLQRRIRRYHAYHGIQHGDIVALTLDTWPGQVAAVTAAMRRVRLAMRS